MPAKQIIILIILSIIIGLPILILFIAGIKRMIVYFFVPKKLKRMVYVSNLNDALQSLKSNVTYPNTGINDYHRDWVNMINERLALIERDISSSSIFFNSEYGDTEIFISINHKYAEMKTKIQKELNNVRPELFSDFSAETEDAIRDSYHQMNSFISETISIINNNRYNEQIFNKFANNNNKDVFIVHGWDHALRDEVYKYLKELSFNPIILSNESNKGNVLIDKFIESAKKVSYAIILMTSDNMVKYDDSEESILQARPNVILEYGYFLSNLGKKRIFLLVDKDVYIPSDISGIVYEVTGDNWKKKLKQELLEVGYDLPE